MSLEVETERLEIISLPSGTKQALEKSDTPGEAGGLIGSAVSKTAN